MPIIYLKSKQRQCQSQKFLAKEKAQVFRYHHHPTKLLQKDWKYMYLRVLWTKTNMYNDKVKLHGYYDLTEEQASLSCILLDVLTSSFEFDEGYRFGYQYMDTSKNAVANIHVHV